MRQKTILLGVIMNCVLLFSCQNNPMLMIDRNGDLIGQNNQTELESLMISVSTDDIIQLQLAEEAMVLYIGNEFCSGCQSLKPNLIQYLLEYQPVMYHFNNLNSSNLLTYDNLVSSFPQIFNNQIQTPSFYFIQRNQRLFHFQSATQEFLTYRTFEALMNYRLKIHQNIIRNPENIQQWIMVKAFESNSKTIENINWIYEQFSNDNKVLSWMNHAQWSERQSEALNLETSYLINTSIQPFQTHDLSQITTLELNDLLFT